MSTATAQDLVARIDALLPQTQCTRCGYAGCAPYAAAIAGGEAQINQCPPGGRAALPPAHSRRAASGVSRHICVLSKPIRPSGTTSSTTRRGESRCRTKAAAASASPGRTAAASAG